MISLTPQQKKLLTFLTREISATGVAPSFSQMAAHMGLSSKSGIHRLLNSLEERGRISRMGKRRQAIEVYVAQCPHCGGKL